MVEKENGNEYDTLLNGLKLFFTVKVGVGALYYASLRIVLTFFVLYAIRLALTKEGWRIGLGALLLVHIYSRVWEPWPYSLNHYMLECLFLAFLCVSPSNSQTKSFIQKIFLTVWLYAALQKLVHGYYLSGEFFLLEILNRHPEWLGKHFDQVDFLLASKVGLPSSLVFGASVLGCLVVLLEIYLPCRVFMGHQPSILAFAALQILVAIATGEYDFLFTNLACTTTFLLPQKEMPYRILAALFVIYGLLNRVMA